MMLRPWYVQLLVPPGNIRRRVQGARATRVNAIVHCGRSVLYIHACTGAANVSRANACTRQDALMQDGPMATCAAKLHVFTTQHASITLDTFCDNEFGTGVLSSLLRKPGSKLLCFLTLYVLLLLLLLFFLPC